MTEKSTVRSVTYDLLRSLGLTTIFGNPGSTEQTFLQEFPDDFSYVLALQEASAIAMADAFAQVTRRPQRRVGRGHRPGGEAARRRLRVTAGGRGRAGGRRPAGRPQDRDRPAPGHGRGGIRADRP
ncbi:MAG: thiamine pyrophosphate-binding protein [Streptosporangiaceae bacterium]